MSGFGNCDAISKIWSAIICTCIHGFVVYRSITRYVVVKEQVISQRFGNDWDQGVVNLLLWSIVISLFFTILCIYAFMQKTGHLANDGVRLMRDSQRNIALLNSGDNTTVCPNTISKTVSVPTCFNIRLFSGILYLLSAYLLLLPIPWIFSEQIKHQAVDPENLWQTDLSFLFPPHPLVSRLTKYTELHGELISDNRLAAASLFSLQPPALGGLGQLPQTEQQLETANRLRWIGADSLVRLVPEISHPTGIKTAVPKSISVELINFVVAGLLIGISLPAVFWHLSVLYACLASFLIGITIIYLTVDYASTSLLIQYTTCLTYPDRLGRGLGLSRAHTYEQLRASLMLIRSPVQLPAWVLILLTGLAFLPYLINFHLLYAFGLACLGQWQSPPEQVEQVHQYYGCHGNAHTSAAVSLQSGYSLHQPADGSSKQANGNDGGVRRNILMGSKCTTVGKCGFSKLLWVWIQSHNGTITALSGICFLFLSTGLRIPVQCELMRVYWENGDPLCLTSMVLFVVCFLAWLLIWIGFTLRRPYLFPLWEPSSMNGKNSSENLMASFHKEHSAFVRCNGDDMRILGVTDENRAMPIFLDGDAVLYSTVQKTPNQISLRRADSRASPLTLPAYDHHWRPSTVAATSVLTERDESVEGKARLAEGTSSISPSKATSDCAQLTGMSDTSGIMKQSVNLHKADMNSSLQTSDGTHRVNAREKPMNYVTETALLPNNGEPELLDRSAGYQTSSVHVRMGKCCDSGTDSYHMGANHHFPVATSPTTKRSNIPTSIADSDCRDAGHQALSCGQNSQRVSYRHVLKTSPYLIMSNTQVETRRDSSDSGDSACKMSENQDCLASIRSYRYNLASLESHLMVGSISNGEGDRSGSPVSLPPPMSTLSNYLYDTPSRQGYPDFTDQPVQQWNEASGLVVLTSPTGSPTNSNDLFEGKLSSQV
ncbi:hypothetical protein D915_000136 [Fasciola hepatica]|uniref:Uncharacterized protein n=1 Tax=Fasciola hepatica TaxID=6192 RepID=A0A4E0RMY4_FASHE|nr:hypothetical protein D915_000136 [Fasciola hepatica]